MTPQELKNKMKTDVVFFISFIIDFYSDELLKKIHENGYLDITKETAFCFMVNVHNQENKALFKTLLRFDFDINKIPEEFREVIKNLK